MANLPEQQINVEVTPTPNEQPPIVYVSQGDYFRSFKVALVNNGAAWTPMSGATFEIVGKKRDKNIFQYDISAALVSGNVLTINTWDQMTAVSGPVVCEIRIHDDSRVYGTSNFILLVEGGVLDGVQSQSTLDVLAQAEQVAQQVHDVSDSVAAAQTAQSAAETAANSAANSASNAASARNTATQAAQTAQAAQSAAETAAAHMAGGSEQYAVLRKKSATDYDYAWTVGPVPSINMSALSLYLSQMWDSAGINAQVMVVYEHTMMIQAIITASKTNVSISAKSIDSLNFADYSSKSILNGSLITSDSVSYNWTIMLPCELSYDDGNGLKNARAIFMLRPSTGTQGQMYTHPFYVIPLDDISWTGEHTITFFVHGTALSMGGNTNSYREV